jgi:hypothetical protein
MRSFLCRSQRQVYAPTWHNHSKDVTVQQVPPVKQASPVKQAVPVTWLLAVCICLFPCYACSMHNLSRRDYFQFLSKKLQTLSEQVTPAKKDEINKEDYDAFCVEAKNFIDAHGPAAEYVYGELFKKLLSDKE